MEEKERFEIHIYDDVCVDLYNNGVLDKSINDTYKLEKLLNQQDKRIKELEETNKVLSNELTKNSILKQRHIETCCGIPIFEIPKMKEENQQLKQQLAEKEKEIERLNLEFETQEDWQEKWQKLYDETCNLNQDKISFAVEQLEKVKELVGEKGVVSSPFGTLKIYASDVSEIIDNQIKELKKGVD